MRRTTVIAGLLGASALLTTTGCSLDLGSDGLTTSTPSAPTASPSSSAAQPASSTAPAQQQLPPGFHRVTDGRQNLSLGVPTEWKVVDFSASDLEAALKQSGLDSPQLRGQMGQLKTLGAVFVADPSSRLRSKSQFLTNVNAFCAPAPATSIDILKLSARQEFQKIGATDIEVTDTTIDGQPAIRTTYVLKVSGTEVRGSQNAAVVGGKACTITLSTDQPDRYRELFDDITANIDLT